MVDYDAFPDLISWQPVPAELPERWIALAERLSHQLASSQYIYILDTRYDARGVGELLRSWGLDWQVVMAGMLWEYENALHHTLLDGADAVQQHIYDAQQYTQHIVNEELSPLLTPPYKNLGALLIALAVHYCALLTLEQQSGGQPYVGVQRANIESARDTLINTVKRLGMWRFKRDIEDLVLHLLDPDRFIENQRLHSQLLQQDDEDLESVRQLFEETYWQTTQKHARVTRTSCGIVGIERRKQDADSEKVAKSLKTGMTGFDLAVFNVTVATFGECYDALGVLNQLGYVKENRIIDQIAAPKLNGYSQIALELVLWSQPSQRRRSCQIRIGTSVMQAVTLYGCLYPRCYRIYEDLSGKTKDDMPLLRQREIWNSQNGQVFSTIQANVNQTKTNSHTPIVVYNKNRELFAFPHGATALDFAFAVDKEIGMHAVEAFINTRKAPLYRKLAAGDIVSITTSAEVQVKEDWRRQAVTSLAQQCINAYLQQRQLYLKGYYMLRQALEQANYMPLSAALDTEIDQLVKQHDLGTRGTFLEKITKMAKPPYTPDWAATQIMQQISQRNESLTEARPKWEPVLDRGYSSQENKIRHQHSCPACEPVYPRDDMHIVGSFHKRNHALIVHRDTCLLLSEQQGNSNIQRLSMQWELRRPPFIVAFFIKAQDRIGLVYDITGLFHHHQHSLLHIHAEVIQHVEAHIHLKFETSSDNQALYYWQALRDVAGVKAVEIDRSFTLTDTFERLQTLHKKRTALPERPETEIIWEVEIASLQPRSPRLKSPFDFSRPAAPAMFFGRSPEIQWLQRELCEEERGKAAILYGPRRSGKSSICRNFIDRYKPQQFCSIVYSLQSADDQDEETTLMQLAEELCSEFSRQIQVTVPRWLDYSDRDPQIRFKKILQSCFSSAPGTRLILALDEFGATLDSYEKQILGFRFFPFWREIMSDFPALSLLLVLQISTHGTLTSKEFSNVFSFAASLGITYLDSENAKKLLRDPLRDQQIAIHPDTAARAVALTGGNPYYLTLIGDFLIGYLDREPHKNWVGNEDLQFVVDQIIESGSNQNFFLLLGELQSQQELAILEKLVELTQETNKPMIRLHQIAGAMHLPPAETRKYLERMRSGLILDEIVPHDRKRASSDPYYAFKIELVRKWLVHNHWFFQEPM
jgi:(p)ppGpp synthase/HD superfamily hydrolase